MTSGKGRCPVCGLEPSSVNPPDASAALRSYPRRYRRLLVRIDDEEGARIVMQRPGPDLWSAVEHASHVADVIDAVSEAVRSVQLHDDPSISVSVGPPRAEPVDAVLDRVTMGSDRLATLVDGIKGKDWQRAGRLPSGERVTALDLARHAVHVGAHHRRLIERVMGTVRFRPNHTTE